MPKYLISGHLPDNFDPSAMTEEMANEIYALNDEMDAAHVTVFACGLAPAGSAKSLRVQPNGEVLVTDGPFLEAKSTSAVFQSSKPRIWTKHSSGRAGAPWPAARRAKCARFFSCPARSNLAKWPTLAGRPARSDRTQKEVELDDAGCLRAGAIVIGHRIQQQPALANTARPRNEPGPRNPILITSRQ
jgi:hypothetical protein